MFFTLLNKITRQVLTCLLVYLPKLVLHIYVQIKINPLNTAAVYVDLFGFGLFDIQNVTKSLWYIIYFIIIFDIIF